MKKLATLAALMAGMGLSFGQAVVHNPGQVGFWNSESAKITGHLVTNLSTGTPLIGAQYLAELYYADSVTAALIPLPASIQPFRASTTTAPGTWNVISVNLPAGYGGVDIFDDGSGEVGDGSGNGTGYYPVNLQVRIWDSTGGLTYDNAQFKANSAMYSYSQRFTPPSGTLNDLNMVRQPFFGIVTVPEPSAIALGILGVAGLLLIRRRK
jgi:hypothetical protein